MSSVRCDRPTSSPAIATATRSSAPRTSPGSSSPPDAETREYGRVSSIVSTRSTEAEEVSTTVALSPSTSTTNADVSASGTSGADPSLTSPTVPSVWPEATPGSQRSRCESDPACCSMSPAAAFEANGDGAAT